MGLTRQETETVVAHTLNQLEHDYGVDVGDLGSPTVSEIAERIYTSANPTPNPRYTWTGWSRGEDDSYPPEPGKEWLTICDDGEEMAIIVLRRDVALRQGGDAFLQDARKAREAWANRIVNALNAQEAK